MGRIRTIKPEFWTHPMMCKLNPVARLMAIALLNMADDEGYFIGEPAVIRAFTFPFDEDSSNVRRAIDELSRIEYISIFDVPQYGLIGRVEKFKQHQRIDRPTASKLKHYIDSTNARRIFDECSTTEGKGKERKGMEGKGLTKIETSSNESTTGIKPDFLDLIIEKFKSVYVQNFGIEFIVTNKGKSRAAAAKILALFKKQHPDFDSATMLDVIAAYFERCATIDDSWIRDHLSLEIINSKFNEINKIIVRGKSAKNGNPKTTDDDIDRIVRTFGVGDHNG
jgi:hypothetical protein